MADTLAIDLLAKVTWLFQDTLDLSTVSDSSNLEYKKSMADGTGNNQSDKMWHDQRTLAAAANDDLDLAGVLTNAFGATVTLVKVKAVLIVNTATTAGEDLVVGAAASNPWQGPFGATTHTIRCEADSCLYLVNKVDGWAVTAGSADTLRINNAGSGSVTYKIVIVGTSA